MEAIGPGTLKLVVGSSEHRPLGSAIEQALLVRLAPEQIRRIGDGAFVVHCEASPDQLRDWLGAALDGGESALVVEFERWSSRGAGVDAGWLLARGH